MSAKGDATKTAIIRAAGELFAMKGFKDVTMTDICDSTGLSRGGLYRHFSSTEEIFNEVLLDEFSFDEAIARGESAKRILFDAFDRIAVDIIDPEAALTFAVYEYAGTGHADFYKEINDRARKNWADLIEYGIRSHEFKRVDVDRTVELIMYYSQGLKLWSKVLGLDATQARNYADTIAEILCK